MVNNIDVILNDVIGYDINRSILINALFCINKNINNRNIIAKSMKFICCDIGMNYKIYGVRSRNRK